MIHIRGRKELPKAKNKPKKAFWDRTCCFALILFEMIFPPYGLILRLLPGGLGRRKYKLKRALWLQSACLALFCGSFRDVWGEGNISPHGHFGFKVLVWPYSAAPSGRFGEKEI